MPAHDENPIRLERKRLSLIIQRLESHPRYRHVRGKYAMTFGTDKDAPRDAAWRWAFDAYVKILARVQLLAEVEQHEYGIPHAANELAEKISWGLYMHLNLNHDDDEIEQLDQLFPLLGSVHGADVWDEDTGIDGDDVFQYAVTRVVSNTGDGSSGEVAIGRNPKDAGVVRYRWREKATSPFTTDPRTHQPVGRPARGGTSDPDVAAGLLEQRTAMTIDELRSLLGGRGRPSAEVGLKRRRLQEAVRAIVNDEAARHDAIAGALGCGLRTVERWAANAAQRAA